MKYLRKHVKQILLEEYKPTYQWLYHGTTKSAAEQIDHAGFNTSLVGSKSGAMKNPGISFTIDGDIASYHALWALKGDFTNPAAVVVVSTRSLEIMNGTEFHRLWNQYSSYDMAIQDALELGYDGIEVWDEETGDGIEEMEVLIIKPREIVVSHINEVDPEDFPEIMEEYS
jgi:hypothetical protein